jgi:hypothetical protein
MLLERGDSMNLVHDKAALIEQSRSSWLERRHQVFPSGVVLYLRARFRMMRDGRDSSCKIEQSFGRRRAGEREGIILIGRKTITPRATGTIHLAHRFSQMFLRGQQRFAGDFRRAALESIVDPDGSTMPGLEVRFRVSTALYGQAGHGSQAL